MKPRDYRIPLLDADLSLQLMINPYKYFCITDQGKEIGKKVIIIMETFLLPYCSYIHTYMVFLFFDENDERLYKP
jgi:hypothetical protein